jgi:hypothetical protein
VEATMVGGRWTYVSDEAAPTFERLQPH